jgi:predicted ATP-dependent endonuclease of OLD family
MSEEKEAGLKILKAEIKNFKNIEYREVEFEGKSALIIGSNGKGKSSLIQAVCSPINSKMIPFEPIKKGEEKGHVILTIGGDLHGEQVKYNVECYFSQEHKRGRLVLKTEDGTSISSVKANLSSILGNISFDIMEFMRMAKTDSGKPSEAGVKKQIELVKSLMPEEAIKVLYELDLEREKIYSERTEIRREIKYIKSDLESNSFTLEDIEKYKEQVSASEYSIKIEKGKEINDNIQKSIEFINHSDDSVKSIDEDIAALQLKRKELLTKKAQCEAFISKHKEVDVDSLLIQMDSISEHNSNHLKIAEMKAKEEKLKEAEVSSEKISERITQISSEKVQLFSSAKLPVKGLTFNESSVMYDGLPLTEEQHPTSRLIAIGLKIGMALNPNLRLLVIKDGSLLDNKTMKYVLDACDKKGYQLLIEQVSDEDSEEVKVEFIENNPVD